MIIRAIVVFLYHLIFSPFARRVDRLYVLISLRNEWGSLWNIYYANVFLRRKGDKSLNITQKLLQCRLPKVSDIVLACNAKKKIGQIKNYAVFRPNHSIIFHPSSSYEEIIKLMTTKDTRRRRMDGWMDRLLFQAKFHCSINLLAKVRRPLISCRHSHAEKTTLLPFPFHP